MQYLAPLITLDFWFNLTPPPFVKPVFLVLGIKLVVMFTGGIVVKWLGHRARKNPPLHRVLSRIGRALLSLSVVGGFLFFFSYEQIYLASARFWWAVVMLWAIVWFVFIIRGIIKNYPREKTALIEKNKREKYLPK